MQLDEDFDADELDPRWTRFCPGGGTLTCNDSVLRLAFPAAVRGRYTDAQIDDYDDRPRRAYPWRPPLRLEVRARASHPQHVPDPTASTSPSSAADPALTSTLHGTAGFGFWNYPFSIKGAMLTLPEAVWFFYASPPANMALVPGVPSCGWKAQVVHAHRWGAIGAAAPTLAAVAVARLTGRERAAAGWVRRLSGAAEAHLTAALTDWHDYVLEWRREAARFWVDGQEALVAPDPPPGPLGFVAWIDNQYAIATPRGDFGFGTLDTGPQWLELGHVRISPL
jgi:hypothetical protein